MSQKPKILAFSGSTRTGSWNKKLVREAAQGALGQGVDVTVIDLADYPLPFYDADLEATQGLPENAKKLQALFRAHDGILIASPDYNGSYPAVLKNMFDWVSRKDAAQPDAPSPLHGKPAAILSTSTGKFGGLKSLDKLDDLLGHLKMMVIPDRLAVPSAAEAFNEAGKITDAKTKQSVENVGASLAKIVKKLSP